MFLILLPPYKLPTSASPPAVITKGLATPLPSWFPIFYIQELAFLSPLIISRSISCFLLDKPLFIKRLAWILHIFRLAKC